MIENSVRGKLINESVIGVGINVNQKKFDRMVAWRDRRVVDVPIDEGIKTYKNVERKDSLVETALSLGVYLGDDI